MQLEVTDLRLLAPIVGDADKTLASMIYVDYDKLTPEPSTLGSDSEDDQPTFISENMDMVLLGKEISAIDENSEE